MLPVDVNATFNTVGGIKPIYIRLEDEEHRLHTYKISGIEYSQEDKHAGSTTIVFVCYIEDEGIQKQLKLSYSLNSHKWVLL
jgi:hypothetical protein